MSRRLGGSWVIGGKTVDVYEVPSRWTRFWAKLLLGWFFVGR